MKMSLFLTGLLALLLSCKGNVPQTHGRDLRLIEKMPPAEVASMIENYMMHQPSAR